MNNIIAINFSTPDEVALQMAARVKARRLELNLTQEGLAARAGIKFATYRRFEQTGEISLKGLLRIGFVLNALAEFDALFAQKQYRSLDEVLNEQSITRKRGQKNE
ncbi:helix-turn-helix domain-containing protein [Bacteroides heparinolyticus]|uniref:helix-turn-helix domain-containing protein n=1 Tax=Prevotella heparinolytica TaxID=28113 RepID=UPI0035A08255